MNQIQIGIANMPVQLILLSNATLAFVRVANFRALFDTAPAADGVDAAFYESEFTIGEDLYSYNVTYAYREHPNMLKWLQQQRLQLPNIIGGF